MLAPAALVATGLAGVAAYYLLAPSEKTISAPADYVKIDSSEVKPDHGPIRRVGTKPVVTDQSTIEILQKTAKKFSNHNFLGHRPFDANGNALDYVWQTYGEVFKRIENFASGLKHEKLLEPTKDGERPLCLYMKNRPEWVIAHYSAMYIGGFAVALYDTLGADSTQFILNQTLSPTIVCTSAELSKAIDVKKSVATLKNIVVVDVDIFPEASSSAAKAAGVKLYTLGQLEAIGASHPTTPSLPKLTDIYCLIYTSGTTGNPKGVPLTHQNILSTYHGAYERLYQDGGKGLFNEEAVHLSYLPLAHCIEHLVHTVMIKGGGAIGYYQGNTLKLTEDLALLRPTLFVTVPRLLNKIYDKVVNGAQAAGGLKAWLFNLAHQTKIANLKQGIRKHALFDKLVFSKVQQKIGLDRCRVVITGSAPLADDVTDFFRILFDCPFCESYGQSETVAGGTITHVGETRAGTVGPPLTTVDIKLVSVNDMGYSVDDKSHGDDDVTKFAVAGRGEICFRGPNVFPGYYKAPDKTAEAFDADGWLHSGDIGVWTLDGRLKIVDRKKNIFKLSQGEYVAPEKIENILITSAYVAQSFVYGDSLHSVLVAIIVPEEEALMNLAKSLNVTGSFAEVCKNAEVVSTVLKDLAALCKKSKLYGFEIVKAIKLHPSPFTVENDMMTPTFKLKRNEAKKAFFHDIEKLYQECGDLVAGKNVHQG